MAPCLTSLPLEVLSQIVRNVYKCGQLLDLALCNRQLHDIVLPYLYSHIKLEQHEVGDLEYEFKYLRTLVFRLLSDPPLAAQIRSITLTEEWNCEAAPEGEKLIPDEKLIPLAEKHLESWPKQERKEWISQIESRNEDATIALLFHAVPNLEFMNIVLPPISADYFMQVMVRAVDKGLAQSNANIQQFTYLHTVANSCDDDKYGMPVNALNSYLRLPSIREIYMQKVGSSDIDINPDDDKYCTLSSLPPGSSTVQHLELRECKLSAQDLEGMFRACKYLKTFIYNLGVGHISYCDYNLPALRENLAMSKETLDNLWIDCYDDTCLMDDLDVLDPFTSLTEFKSLKNLKVGMYVLFGIHEAESESGSEDPIVESKLPNLGNIFPENLETLYLSGTDDRIGVLVKALENLLRVKQECVPKLREVAFEAYLEGNQQAPSLEMLKSAAADADVRLRPIDIEDPDDEDYKTGRGWDDSITWAGHMNNEGYSGHFTLNQ
ncbi:MAG: hypothetical protein Q9222_004651 [Ikaeria aurantiellina]